MKPSDRDPILYLEEIDLQRRLKANAINPSTLL
jgi:hypothetical protein